MLTEYIYCPEKKGGNKVKKRFWYVNYCLHLLLCWCRWIDECPSHLNFLGYNGSGHVKFCFIIRKRCKLNSWYVPRSNLSPSHIHFVTTQKHFFFSTLIFFDRFAFVHNFKGKKYARIRTHLLCRLVKL